MTEVDYGRGVRTIWSGSVPDLDPYFGRVSGPSVVLHAVLRRLVTPTGSLPWAEDLGFDVRRLLNSKIASSQLARIEAVVRAQCLDDDRVAAADVTVTFVGSTLTIAVRLGLSDGSQPFAFVFDVSEAGVKLL